ncbi:unnamed protein product [Spirodela intermedia]|uniref:Cobalamin-independent methionine synthase MetE N-terminal domain-containing protein n=1 Tax=Spirodela intermedia TaxID=51605 RepID=A0A7I8IPZ6_SPIIN|nr:unnamed protein product [Spirodela intermedia]CAA6659871.1 unnamed protein product [Spirodela intermedia]
MRFPPFSPLSSVSIWKQMSDAGIKYIPSNTFSFYDQMLYTTAMLGAAPDRYGYTGGKIGHDIYFSMARAMALCLLWR